MKRPLSPDEIQILERFDKWCNRLFGSLGRTLTGATPVFSTTVYPDAHGNLLIDSGRAKLIPPKQGSNNMWGIQPFDVEDALWDGDLTRLLFRGLKQALHRDFVSNH